jgi:choloylglycine hydrolase
VPIRPATFHRLVLLCAACLAIAPRSAVACTRCVYLGPNGTVLVARSMDWVEDPSS